MCLPSPLKVDARRLTGVAGNTSSVLDTSSTPSWTVATTTGTCTLSATATVNLGEGPLHGGPIPFRFPSSTLAWCCRPSPSFKTLLCSKNNEWGALLAAWARPRSSWLSLWAPGESWRYGSQAESLVCGRLKDCSGKTNSSRSRDVGPTCSRDRGSTCFNIIHTPCFEFIPEEECVEQIWHSWCKGHRPLSVAVIHHPIHHVCRTDNLHEKEDEEEEEEEETPPSIPTQLCPTAVPTDPDIGAVTRTPDSAAPITIWRSESPTGKSQEGKATKKIKKKKEKEKDNEDEMVDEKAKLKKKVKGKIIKKKSLAKSESSPPDLSRSLSPRELVRTSESSPESREELESEDSYERGKKEPSSEDIVESSPKKREKSTSQAKKNGTKTLQTRKTSKRKSPPVSNPNLS